MRSKGIFRTSVTRLRTGLEAETGSIHAAFAMTKL